MRPGDPKYRCLFAVWGFLEVLGFGGLIFGWGSLVIVLKDEGLYLDLCTENNDTESGPGLSAASRNASNGSDPSNESCDERDSMLALAFTVGSSMFCVGSFFMGNINFKYGTRITRIISMILFILGSIMMAFTDNDTPWLLFPGLSILAIGGISYLLTNISIGVLFPAGGSIVIGLMSGGFDASSGMQLLVKVGYENGVSRQTSFIILACAHLLTLVSTFFFMPKGFLKAPPLDVTQPEDVADDETKAELVANSKMREDVPVRKIPPLKSSMTSPYYILHLVWLCILQLRLYFFLGAINTILEDLLDTEEEVSQSSDVFSYILMFGIIGAPFAGFIYDSQKRCFRAHKAPVLAASIVPLTIASILTLMWSGLLLVGDPRVLNAVFVLVLLTRSFLYAIGSGFLSACFPIEHFGILGGLMLLAGGVVGFSQYAFFSWAEASGFYQVNIFCFVMVFISFVHPLYLWRQCFREQRSASFN